MVAMVSYQNDYDGLYVYNNANAIIVYDFDNIAIQTIALPNTGISQYTNPAVDEVIFHTIEQVFTTPANAHHIRIRVGGILTGGSGQTKDVVFDISRINLVKGGLTHAYKPAPNELTFGQAYYMKPALNLDNILNASGINVTGNITTSTLTSNSITTGTLSSNTVNTDRLQGKTSSEVIYIGTGTCHFNVTDGFFRIKSSSNNYIVVTPTGRVAIYVGGVTKHVFMEDGTKRGGSIVIDDVNYGMSPIDSPEVLISDLIRNVKMVKGLNIINLDDLTAKAIDGYSVFFENSNGLTVTEKNKNSFTVKADNDVTTDIYLIGNRIEYKGHKWEKVTE
jgi:hypothetical protein